jgi:hypothetical protein
MSSKKRESLKLEDRSIKQQQLYQEVLKIQMAKKKSSLDRREYYQEDYQCQELLVI